MVQIVSQGRQKRRRDADAGASVSPSPEQKQRASFVDDAALSQQLSSMVLPVTPQKKAEAPPVVLPVTPQTEAEAPCCD